MSKRAFLLPGLALVVTLAAAPTGVQPSTEWIKRTRDRIELLLGPRRDTAPRPAGNANPFRPPGPSAPTTPVDTAATARITDAETLARLAATLKINGLVQIAGVPHVIINQLSYKEGDLVAVREKDQTTYLRVVRVTTTGLVLELNKIEQTILLK